MLLNPKLVLCADGWARSHHLRYMHLAASLPLAEIFPPNRQSIARVLSIRNNKIIGADGRSAISITILDNQAGNMLRYSLAAPEVQELWLGIYSGDLAQVMRRMQQVNTLVIVPRKDSSASLKWLEQIPALGLFPALQEVRIIIRDESSGPAILRFLQCRDNAGQRIRRLRFFKDPYHTG